MSKKFINQYDFTEILKHKNLPIYKTQQFSFYRCVNVGQWVYNKTISQLNKGNLRDNSLKGRYSNLFPREKISYWADSKITARAEIKKHGGNNNYLLFWAYDDASSTFPTSSRHRLKIIDGRELGFKEILEKLQNNEKLTKEEEIIIKRIGDEKPDCLAYESKAKKDGLNFLFYEKGFAKLALREVDLYSGENKNKNTKKVYCATGSDFSPIIENYGKYFERITKVRMDISYLNEEEYKLRKSNYQEYINDYNQIFRIDGFE